MEDFLLYTIFYILDSGGEARLRYPPLVVVRKRKLVGAKNATAIMSQLSQILRQLLNMELEI